MSTGTAHKKLTDIWRSQGEDDAYTFGYSEDDLRQAADAG